MSTKISALPTYIGPDSPLGDIPISINGTTYKITPEKIKGGITLTPNTALIANGAGQISSSLVSSNELFTLKNITGNIQTQLNLVNGLPYLGSITPTSPAYTGTSAAFWTATQAGTYTNYGNVVVSGNSFATISRTSGGTYSISQTPLDFTKYTQRWESEGSYIGRNFSINLNTSTFELTTTLTSLNSLFAIVGETYFNIISGTTAVVSTQSSPSTVFGINYLVLNKLDSKLYIYNYTKISDIQNTDFIYLGSFFFDITNSNIKGENFTIDNISKDIIYAKKWDTQGSYVGNTTAFSINLNSTTKQLTTSVTNQLWVVNALNFSTIVSGTTDVVSTQTSPNELTGVNYLVFNKSDSKLYVYNYTKLADVQNTNFVYLGSFFNNKPATLMINGDNFTIDNIGKVEKIIDGLAFGTSKVTIDRTTNKIIIPKFYYTAKGKPYITKQATDYGSSTAFTFNLQTNGGILDTLIFDPYKLEATPSVNPFSIESLATINTMNDRCIIICQMIGGVVTTTYNFTDTADIGNTTWDKIGTIASRYTGADITPNIVNVNLTTKQVEVSVTGSNCFANLGAQYYSVISGTTSVVSTQTSPNELTGINYIVYNKTDSKIYVYNYTSRATIQNNNYIFLGSFYNGDSNSIYSLETLSNIITINGVSKNTALNPSVTTVSNELLLPSKIWMINNENLPLYKTSLVRNVNDLKNEIIISNSATTNTDFSFPSFESKTNDFILNPTNLKSNIRILSKNYLDTAFDYGVDISIIKTDPATKSGLTKNWFCWGDSLTNRGVANYTKGYLSGFSVTMNTYGTMTNSSQNGEGREGWTWTNFIGQNNVYMGGGAIIIQPTGSTSTLNLNPFIRLATSADTTAHPTWCFRNTGSANELSYSSDADKTGNFYIFDALNYTNNHLGGVVPDVFTVCLGTNDITVNGATGIVNSLLGLEIILSKMKEAFPSIKIGVIPANVRGDNGQAHWLKTCDLINQMNAKLTALALSNVETIGVWIHQDRNTIFPYTATTNLLSDGNLTKKFTKGDSIHFDRNGYLPYAKALGAYIISVI